MGTQYTSVNLQAACSLNNSCFATIETFDSDGSHFRGGQASFLITCVSTEFPIDVSKKFRSGPNFGDPEVQIIEIFQFDVIYFRGGQLHSKVTGGDSMNVIKLVN